MQTWTIAWRILESSKGNQQSLRKLFVVLKAHKSRVLYMYKALDACQLILLPKIDLQV